MKLIVGLGNPGKEYNKTRHNVGFMVLDKIIDENSIGRVDFKFQKKLKSEIVELKKDGEKILLLKPNTYMNLSGEAVKLAMDYFKISLKDIWIICDDVNLDLGIVRVRKNGSDGGHNGLKSIVNLLGTDEFVRFRVGIGKDDGLPMDKYVLQRPTQLQRKIIKKTIDKLAGYLIRLLSSEEEIEETTINYN